MRDRLVALGMRRPTRVKDEDYDVPMLTEDDFEIQALDENNSIVPANGGGMIRDVEAQRKLAQMCIAKAKLCLCISHVLSAQYSVLVRHQGMQGQEGSTRSSVMLFPKKLDQTDEVKRCDVELSQWVEELPACCQYSNELPEGDSGSSLFLQRSLLHMVYFTTLSALHRPQVLPSAPLSQPDSSRELQDLSRKKVREASREITRISSDLHTRGLEKYLPTTGVTVLLPAIIIHLLDIKSCNDEARQTAMDGFCQCMLVLEKLRDNYSSADFATQFLEAAIRKADIDVVIGGGPTAGAAAGGLREGDVLASLNSERVKELRVRSKIAAMRRTPPPVDVGDDFTSGNHHSMDIRIPSDVSAQAQEQRNDAPTPPDSDAHSISIPHQDLHQSQLNSTNHVHHHLGGQQQQQHFGSIQMSSLDLMSGFGIGGGGGGGDNIDLNDFLNFDVNGIVDGGLWNVPLDEGAHGESGGFMGDMNWIEQGPGWSRLNTPGLEEDGGGMFGGGGGPGQGEVEVNA